MINALHLKEIIVFDPHSDVGPALLDRCKVINQCAAAAFYIQSQVTNNDYVLISPDAGAFKKTSKLAEHINVPVIVATKKRNVADGKLSDPEVLGDVRGKVCFIVDDICDGGRTFINLAVALKSAGASECHLFISHGIFSNGYEDLSTHFTSIGTTDSFKPANEYPETIYISTISN